jgi:peptidyl-prolyl cis-trans isomerase D
MLDFLRKRKRNWVIILFLGVIVVTFALFVGSGDMGSRLGTPVAEVNGEAISQREFALQYEREVQRYRELLKGALTPEMLKGLNIKANLVETLIQRKLVLQEARNLGLSATDDELADAITKVPEFQIGGRFSKDRYLQVLQANRLVPAQFEEEQRDQLTIQRLYSVILDAVHVTDAEARERYRIEQEKINVQFVKLPVGNFVGQVQLSDDEIQKHYERNKDSLKEPLKIQIEYLAYAFDQFAGSMEVSEKEIEEYYMNNKSQFHRPKEAKVRYISISLAPGATAEQKSAARAGADTLVKEARSGKDFAQLAKRESSDSSAGKGGDIGWITAGQMPAPVEAAIFSLSKGAVSEPIETPAGYQIFKVEDIREERTLSLKEASGEIAKTLRTEKAKREAAKVADADREKAIAGADFAKIAANSRGTVKTTDWFTQGELLPEIGENQDFYKNAFAIGSKDTSPLIEGTNAYYLLRLKQRREAAVPPLESVKNRIETGLRESKAYELALQRGNALLQQLQKERDIQKVAQSHGLKIDETGWFPRNAAQLPKIGELAEMKGAPLNLTEQKRFPDKLFTQKDALYVLAFKGSQGADMEQFEREKDAIKKQALAESRQRALFRFMEGLKSKAKIELNTAFLEEA